MSEKIDRFISKNFVNAIHILEIECGRILWIWKDYIGGKDMCKEYMNRPSDTIKNR